MKQFGRVENGKLKLKDKIRFNNDLSKFEGKDIVIKIREVEVGRSMEQNALYWKWVDIMANELGYEKQQMSMLIKYKFLQRETVNKLNSLAIFLAIPFKAVAYPTFEFINCAPNFPAINNIGYCSNFFAPVTIVLLNP